MSYQVANKQELEVIYEPVEAATSRTVWLVLAGLVLVLCLAGGTAVALWQSGALDQTSQPGERGSHINSSTSPWSSSTTSPSPSSSSSSMVDHSGRQTTSPSTTPTTTTASSDLILDTRWDKKLMLLLGNPSTILGHWR